MQSYETVREGGREREGEREGGRDKIVRSYKVKKKKKKSLIRFFNFF
jgi:hypothetical protein